MKYKKFSLITNDRVKIFYILKKENIDNLNTFQEKLIILCNNGCKIWKNKKISKSFFGYKTKENQ